MALDISQFRTRNALDRFALKYVNEQKDYIADEIFTPVPVEKSEAKVYHYDSSHLKEVETRSDSKAEANKVDYGVFTRDVALELHKLAGDVDPKDAANADASVSDLRFNQTENIMSRLLIKRERLAVALVSTSANFPSGLVRTLGADATWSSNDGNPEGDIAAMGEAVWAQCGRWPNALAIGALGLSKMKQSPALKAKISGISQELLTESQIMNMLGIKYLHVSHSRYDTAAKGVTASTAEIWDDFALLYVKDPSPNPQTIRFGAKYIRKDLYTYQYLDEKRGGPDGRIEVIEKGWEYVLQAGAVVGSADGDFAAGALIDNIY